MLPNYHTHTRFCDGADSPEELILEALRLGCPEIGFSGHSYIEGENWCMSAEGTEQYIREICRLKEQYRDRIRIRLGIEQDILSDIDRNRFEYVIGAVHYVMKGESRFSVDYSKESFLETVRTVYGGDFYAFTEDYFALVGEVWERTHCDIIAHFDLVTKYNEDDCLFDTAHPRYRRAAEAALDRLRGSPAVLEINTGAIARGYRITPYPAPWILERWRAAGGKVIWSSDCHDRRFLLCGFPESDRGFWEERL